MSLGPAEFLRIADAALAIKRIQPWWKRLFWPSPVVLSLTVATPLDGGPTGRPGTFEGQPVYDFTARQVEQLRAIVLKAAASELDT